MQNKYPNLPKLYQELRKEKLPFRPQYDESRAPVFTSDEATVISGTTKSFKGSSNFDKNEDVMLQAALAASLNDNKRSSFTQGFNDKTSLSSTNVSKVSTAIIESVTNSSNILKEMIVAASSISEIVNNDIIDDLLTQISKSQTKLTQHIERAVIEYPQDIDVLFKVNDEVQSIVSTFNNIKKGSYNLEKAKSVLLDSNSKPPIDISSIGSNNKSSGSSGSTGAKSSTSNSLLDFGSSFLPSRSARSSVTNANNSNNNNPKQSEMFEETMGLYSMTSSTSPFDSRTKRTSSVSLPPPAPTPTPQVIAPVTKVTSPTNVDVFDLPSNSKSTKSLFDDPFGPSSSIDALLLESKPVQQSASNQLGPSTNSNTNNILDLFGASTPATNLLPIPQQSPPPQPQQQQRVVDPLDGLFAIASRQNVNDEFSFPQPTVTNQRTAYNSNPPIAPPPFSNEIPSSVAYPNIPNGNFPQYNPAYPPSSSNNNPFIPANFAEPANVPQPPGPSPNIWPQQPQANIQVPPGAPDPFWQINSINQIQGNQQQPSLYSSQAIPPANQQKNNNQNPFDLYF
eukprot:CAMPEP_0196763304 /NCGR_PEP_ID=MMETSP1095-20130614/3794_1 /TAXON_ID=96789 ORGANISM="Chromulina nebulosa, Strain UTEXLB2642" /NCGR_SAMPLE_ID=MMETSP1095 /ASSEMBLY_ACC=CAM_ASM_000446 /LENGTH=565 /DNA_ID=CAMNT_0042116187 /DNA_START=401 /DNA_END=2098 /DNA_ORIENTATION=-